MHLKWAHPHAKNAWLALIQLLQLLQLAQCAALEHIQQNHIILHSDATSALAPRMHLKWARARATFAWLALIRQMMQQQLAQCAALVNFQKKLPPSANHALAPRMHLKWARLCARVVRPGGIPL